MDETKKEENPEIIDTYNMDLFTDEELQIYLENRKKLLEEEDENDGKN